MSQYSKSSVILSPHSSTDGEEIRDGIDRFATQESQVPRTNSSAFKKFIRPTVSHPAYLPGTNALHAQAQVHSAQLDTIRHLLARQEQYQKEEQGPLNQGPQLPSRASLPSTVPQPPTTVSPPHESSPHHHHYVTGSVGTRGDFGHLSSNNQLFEFSYSPAQAGMYSQAHEIRVPPFEQDLASKVSTDPSLPSQVPADHGLAGKAPPIDHGLTGNASTHQGQTAKIHPPGPGQGGNVPTDDGLIGNGPTDRCQASKVFPSDQAPTNNGQAGEVPAHVDQRHAEPIQTQLEAGPAIRLSLPQGSNGSRPSLKATVEINMKAADQHHQAEGDIKQQFADFNKAMKVEEVAKEDASDDSASEDLESMAEGRNGGSPDYGSRDDGSDDIGPTKRGRSNNDVVHQHMLIDVASNVDKGCQVSFPYGGDLGFSCRREVRRHSEDTGIRTHKSIAVQQLGLQRAVPKSILNILGVKGMTRENVASHLQKYRQFLKRMDENPSQARPPPGMEEPPASQQHQSIAAASRIAAAEHHCSISHMAAETVAAAGQPSGKVMCFHNGEMRTVPHPHAPFNGAPPHASGEVLQQACPRPSLGAGPPHRSSPASCHPPPTAATNHQQPTTILRPHVLSHQVGLLPSNHSASSLPYQSCMGNGTVSMQDFLVQLQANASAPSNLQLMQHLLPAAAAASSSMGMPGVQPLYSNLGLGMCFQGMGGAGARPGSLEANHLASLSAMAGLRSFSQAGPYGLHGQQQQQQEVMMASQHMIQNMAAAGAGGNNPLGMQILHNQLLGLLAANSGERGIGQSRDVHA
eukprot:gene18599-25113_t